MLRTIFSFSALMISAVVSAESLHIAVASNFADSAREIAERFRTTSGHEINVSSASSGKLYAQIQHGAPFDIFLSADAEKPELLAHEYPETQFSLYTYALGRVVLWCPERCKAPLTDLQSGRLEPLAIANPRVAPYGKASMEVLNHLGVSSVTQVQGENISQAYRFIASGSAPIGFIARAQVREMNNQTHWLAPRELHAPIRQRGVITPKGLKNPAALQFMNFLKSDDIQKFIHKQGYDAADE